MEGLSLRFVTVARALAASARAQRLVAPAFRSPPRLVGVSRSICRRRDGAVVSVALRARPWSAVLADMVEGVVAANRLRGVAADRCRTALWQAVEGAEQPEAPVPVVPGPGAEPDGAARTGRGPHAESKEGADRADRANVRAVRGNVGDVAA